MYNSSFLGNLQNRSRSRAFVLILDLLLSRIDAAIPQESSIIWGSAFHGSECYWKDDIGHAIEVSTVTTPSLWLMSNGAYSSTTREHPHNLAESGTAL
jgi:hypothetical protein